jgi:uncharacterized protein YsxB (DUF464 family)
MIVVRFRDDQNRIQIKGHAGYAEHGKDIVCAAMSGLAWTLAAILHHKGGLLEAKEDSGEMNLRYCGNVDEYLDMFQVGAEMLETKYPQHVRVEGRRSLLYDDTIEAMKGGAEG